MGIVAAAIPYALAGQATARCAPVLHVRDTLWIPYEYPMYSLYLMDTLCIPGQATARCAPVLHVGLDAGVIELAADQALGIIHGVARVQSRLQFRSCIGAEMCGVINSAISSHLYDLEEVA